MADLKTELEQAMRSQFKMEVDRLQKLQLEVDERREREAVQRKEEQDKLLRTILEGQVSDAEERRKNRRFIMRYIVAPIASILTVVGGGLGYMKATETPKEKVDAGDVQETVRSANSGIESQIADIEKRMKRHDRIHERIVNIQLDQQVELSDSVEFLGKKIDKISTRAATVPEPDSVTAGREKSDAIKRSRGDEPDYDPAAPLADLTEP